MVNYLRVLGALATLSSMAAGLPRPLPQDDSAIGIEVAVSAPNGIPLTDSVELASQSAREAGVSTAAAPVMTLVSYGEQKKSEPAPVISLDVAHSSPSPVHVPAPVQNLPQHGSGSADWGNKEYSDCVSQCMATHGQKPGAYAPTPTAAHSGGVAGTGATHTVIVAPTQGVLRYIPFAVNASVGDTIKFMWGANNHTVTKSSALLPCNRTGDALFASGVQNKDFIYHQVVNDTKPTYFFCGTPGHCQKGMFGIINPTTKFASPSSVGPQMQSIAQKSPNVAGYADITTKATINNAAAARWGSNIDMAEIPDWAHEYVAENVLYTRNFLAENPETLKDDGSVDLSTASTVPLSIPQDVAAALNNAGASSPSSSAAASSTPAASSAASEPSTSGTAESQTGSASSLATSPKVMFAVAAVVATLLL